MATGGHRELKGVGYEVFILLLSVLSVVNLAFLIIARFANPAGGPGQEVVLVMDTVITPIFLFDFLYRFVTASSRSRYFFRGWGWADLLSCLPLLRVFRAFRVVRVIGLLRQHGPARIGADLVEARASAVFLLTLFLVVVVLEVTGASIYYVEVRDPAANITTAGDAIWWGLVTITTVGYGDQYPVTEAGRVIGVFLLFAGIGLFSVLTGFIANVFLAPPAKPRLQPRDRAASEISAVRALLAEQDERAATIRAHLDELERRIEDSRPRTNHVEGVKPA
jgi:voltage-gated potassium channel Kch